MVGDLFPVGLLGGIDWLESGRQKWRTVSCLMLEKAGCKRLHENTAVSAHTETFVCDVNKIGEKSEKAL